MGHEIISGGRLGIAQPITSESQLPIMMFHLVFKASDN